MIKLIASDMDGTLLPEGTADIGADTYELIRALQARGVTFVAASGRNYESVMSVFGCMEKEITVISDNGGYVARCGEGISHCGFSRELLTEVVQEARKVPDAWMMASAARGTYTDQNDPKYVRWVREGYRLDIRLVDDLLTVEEPLVKVALYMHDTDAAVAAEPLRRHFGDRINLALAGERWIDMMVPAVSKGAALARLRQTLGITREETAVFGDNGNDIPMFAQAAHSYAVANAREEVRAAAGHVIGDVRERAVQKQLRVILESL